MLEKYEHAKNRKRVERYENSGWDSSVMELSFDEYSDWPDKASKVRRLYLQGKVSREQFKKIIGELLLLRFLEIGIFPYYT